MPQPAGTPEPSGAVDSRPDVTSIGDAHAGHGPAEATPIRPESEHRLRRAIDDREFTPHFQPIVSLESGELLAAEALARWTPASDDPVPPSGFLGLAEETGLIRSLGRQLIDRSVALLGAWGDAAPARVHLNVSGPELDGDATLATALRNAAGKHGIHLGRFCVEVSERQAEVSSEQVRRLRELGVQVALDDFGSGYSSYALLGSLPVTDLKIDGSLVRSLDSGKRSRAVVEHIVDLARDLGVRVVAEGIQTTDQARRLREAGCRVGQGFLFGRPRGPEDFEETLLTATGPRSNGSSG